MLTVTGLEDRVDAFAAAAAGPGLVPWRRDFAAEEEDVFHRLAARYPRTGRLSLAECRIFAGQLRERLQDHHLRAQAAAEERRACPLDLHALLPVPPSLLALGADDPTSRRWCVTHWGTTELRRVVVLPPARMSRRRPFGVVERRYGFHAEGAAPHAAARRLGRAWPDLGVELRVADAAG